MVKSRADAISDALALGSRGENSVLKRLEAQYISHYANLMEVEESWLEVRDALLQMERPDVLAVHRMSEANLDYSAGMSSKVIAIGGLKLSRGLTLEGLVVSYFYRRSMTYDTLMQMARWFGYRDGYKDLLRLWITSDVAESFFTLPMPLRSSKNFLSHGAAKKEPGGFGIRVRSHPDALATVTANNKMRTGQQYPWVRYDDRLLETFFVDCRDPGGAAVKGREGLDCRTKQKLWGCHRNIRRMVWPGGTSQKVPARDVSIIGRLSATQRKYVGQGFHI